MTTTTSVVPDSPPRTSYIAQAAPQPTAMPQTDEYYHSLAYYKAIDFAGQTFSKIDSKDPVSYRVAKVGTDKIHEVLREFIREPIIRWSRQLAKNAKDQRPSDLGIVCNANLLPAADSRRLVHFAGTQDVGMRIPLQVAQNLAQELPLCDINGPLGIELSTRIAVVFYYAFRPELHLLKALYNRTASEKASDDVEFLRTFYAFHFNPTSMISHLASEVFRRMVAEDERFARDFEVGYTLMMGDHKLGIVSSPFGYEMVI